MRLTQAKFSPADPGEVPPPPPALAGSRGASHPDGGDDEATSPQRDIPPSSWSPDGKARGDVCGNGASTIRSTSPTPSVTVVPAPGQGASPRTECMEVERPRSNHKSQHASTGSRSSLSASPPPRQFAQRNLVVDGITGGACPDRLGNAVRGFVSRGSLGALATRRGGPRN